MVVQKVKAMASLRCSSRNATARCIEQQSMKHSNGHGDGAMEAMKVAMVMAW